MSKVKLILGLSTAIIVDIRIEISIILQMSDWLHPSKIQFEHEEGRRRENKGWRMMMGVRAKAKLNFYWISITFTYSNAMEHRASWMGSHKKRTGHIKNPSHKRWSILNYYRWIQNVLCTCVNQLSCSFDCSMYQINATTHTYVSSLICNQKLMKITLQPHFSAV